MRTALELLFEREFDAMVGLARLMLGPGPDADDVVMTSFVSTAARIDTLDSPGAYLRATVVNGCRRKLRDAKRHRRIWNDRVVPAARQAHVDDDHEYVDDLLDKLSDRERTAIVLTYYLDLSTAETADAMGCPRGTVKSLVSRGLSKMRRVVVT